MDVKALLKKRETDLSNLSDKQFLVHLKDKEHLTPLQLRAAAQAYDRMAAAGSDDPLAETLKAVSKGGLDNPDRDSQLQQNLPVLDDAPEESSAKQKLIWLRENGAINPRETRIAASFMSDGHDLTRALIKAGAGRVLTKVPGASGMKIALGGNVEDAEGWIGAQKNTNDLLDGLRHEWREKRRKGVRDAVVGRLEDLGVEDAALVVQRTINAALQELGEGEDGPEGEEEEGEGEEEEDGAEPEPEEGESDEGPEPNEGEEEEGD